MKKELNIIKVAWFTIYLIIGVDILSFLTLFLLGKSDSVNWTTILSTLVIAIYFLTKVNKKDKEKGE